MPAASIWPPELEQPTAFQESAFSGDQSRPSRLARTLLESDDPALQRLAERLAGCARSPAFYIEADAPIQHLCVPHCNVPGCDRCDRRKAAIVAANLEDLTAAGGTWRSGNLTLRSIDGPLAAQYARLRRCLARLRRTRFWQQHVAGGVYRLHCTLNLRTRQWHPHIHFVVRGTYMPHDELAAEWLRITGDSDQVWIEKIRDGASAPSDLASYLGAAPNMRHWPDAAVVEFYQANAHRRQVQTFGDVRGVSLTTSPAATAVLDRHSRVYLSQIIFEALARRRLAVAVIPLMVARYPKLAGYVENVLPGFLADHPGPGQDVHAEELDSRIVPLLLAINDHDIRMPP